MRLNARLPRLAHLPEAPNMNPIGLLMRELRRDTAMARTARKAIKQVLALRVPPNALH